MAKLTGPPEGPDYSNQYEGSGLTSPLIEGPHGPMNLTQPDLAGDCGTDPLGYLPDGVQKKRKESY